MIGRWLVAVEALILLAVPASAIACERDPYLFRLPGETEFQSRERGERIFAEQAIAQRFNRETNDFEKATQVYLARVVSRKLAERTAAKWTPPSTRVQVIEAFKGPAKTGERDLIDDGGSGVCVDHGDGLGAHADYGTLVVVFEGLPISRERPRGVDSFSVEDIRTAPLLYKLLGLYGSEEQ